MQHLIAKTRLDDGKPSSEDIMLRLYSSAMATAAAEVVELWSKGEAAPSKDMHVEVVKVVSPTGEGRGFNVYLVWDQPRRLGKMREEPV